MGHKAWRRSHADWFWLCCLVCYVRLCGNNLGGLSAMTARKAANQLAQTFSRFLCEADDRSTMHASSKPIVARYWAARVLLTLAIGGLCFGGVVFVWVFPLFTFLPGWSGSLMQLARYPHNNTNEKSQAPYISHQIDGNIGLMWMLWKSKPLHMEWLCLVVLPSVEKNCF